MPRIEFNAPATILYAFAAVAATLAVQVAPAAVPGVHGPVSLDPGFVISLFTWTLPHADASHLIGNFVTILLVGPILEKHYGTGRMFGIYALGSAVVGLVHCLLAPGYVLIGASGTAFLCITMGGLISGRASGRIPLTFAIVAVLYLGREVIDMLGHDDVSQTAHLAGGVLGTLLGLRRTRR